MNKQLKRQLSSSVRIPRQSRPSKRRGGPGCKNACGSGKRRYRDAREATEALQRIGNRRNVANSDGIAHTWRQCRKYYCDSCNGYHLTSWESPGTPPQSRLADDFTLCA